MKKTLALILTFIMVLALVPTVAFAAGNTIYVDAKNGDDANDGSKDNPYKTVGKAAAEAASGSTIYLADGNYSTYTPENQPNYGKKNLTFIGNSKDKVIWQIGAETPNPALLGTEYNGDYSFDSRSSGEHDYTIKFQNLTLMSADKDYLGFIGADHTVVEDCTMLGRTAYWGYKSATFKDTTFNCPNGSYALWTYSSPTMTFDNCIFNSSGKVINVYNEGDTPNVTVYFNNCTVNSENPDSLSVMNINDTYVQSFTINFNGKNTINGIKADGIEATDGSHASAASNTTPPLKKTSAQATCSKLFEFNMKYGNGNNGYTTVNIDNTPVWKNGQRVGHAIDTTNDKYTDGYKDNAFEITPTTGGYVKTCKYCGYTEPFYGELSNEIGLKRTVNQGQEVKIETTTPKDTYKVNGSSGITVDYTATMDMTKLKWEKPGSLSAKIPDPWQMLATQPDRITEDTVVFLKFTFDKNIDLKAFKATYEAAVNAGKSTDVLMLTSDMFKIADGGVQFDTANNTMTITCQWKEDATTDNHFITLYGCGLPVTNDWNGSKQINIENSGCVSGTVHINPMGGTVEIADTGLNVAANVQVASTTPSLDTIQIPIVGGCKTDEFTLYYGGGSSDDSSGGSSSGGGYYHPTTTPVPGIVIPPKTGDMTVWQSILHFLGIR